MRGICCTCIKCALSISAVTTHTDSVTLSLYNTKLHYSLFISLRDQTLRLLIMQTPYLYDSRRNNNLLMSRRGYVHICICVTISNTKENVAKISNKLLFRAKVFFIEIFQINQLHTNLHNEY